MTIDTTNTIAYLAAENDKLRKMIEQLMAERVIHLDTIKDLASANIELIGEIENDTKRKSKD